MRAGCLWRRAFRDYVPLLQRVVHDFANRA
jgi:hypothetical protein